MFRKPYFVSLFFKKFKAANILRVTGFISSVSLVACSSTPVMPELPGNDVAHLSFEDTSSNKDIPAIVEPLPLLNKPQTQVAPELYSVVAQDVSVRELLFAMARDASINIDVHPGITGQVSINAIDQALPQILERVSNQVDLRWSYDTNGNLLVEPDSPYWKTYRVDYVNVERTATTTVNVSNTITSIGDGGDGGNESTATISQSSTNAFWASLTANLTSLLGEGETEEDISVITNAESGVINIRANSREHEDVASFLNFVQNRALQEVMIEVTIVEVDLSDDFQSGVDWTAMARNSGRLNIAQDLIGGNLNASPFTSLTISEGTAADDISATVKLLSEFGESRTLSSPKIMALNNQPAMLRVVDNIVYFSLDVETGTQSLGTVTPSIITTELHTVPVGFVMTITPQIGQNGQITLNVRPTISRIIRFVNDPNPKLADVGVKNPVPEIQIREIESTLKVFNGEIAVLGGLMQDTLSTKTAGLPGLSRIPGVRNLFSARDDTGRKTELIIFIQPVIVQQPSLNGDLERYQEFLPASSQEFFNQNTFIQPLN